MKFSLTGDKTYIIRLYKGEEPVAALKDFASKIGKCGFFAGIGALNRVELGYFDFIEKSYSKKIFTGNFELLSLQGNISLKDGSYFPHAHAVLGNKDYSTFGGHLFSGEISITTEIVFVAFEKPVTRSVDDETGLWLLDPE
jgi:uncharacterized protein